MKTNKILVVGAAFLMMISCDNNSGSFNKIGNDKGVAASHIQADTVSPLSGSSSGISSLPMIENRHDL